MARIAELTVRVHLDDAALPLRIEWGGSEVGFDGLRGCDAASLTLWDGERRALAALGLWTRDTRLEDMHAYLCQSLAQLADTCRRATADEELAALIEACADELAARVLQPPGTPSLVLRTRQNIREEPMDFCPDQGARRSHSHDYGDDEQG